MNLSIKKWFLASFIAVSMAFVGCDLLGGDDENDSPTVGTVTLDPASIDAVASAKIKCEVSDDKEGMSVTIKVLDTADTDVTANFDITVLGVGSGEKKWDLGDVDEGNATIKAKDAACAGTYTVKIEATDSDGAGGNNSATLTLTANGSSCSATPATPAGTAVTSATIQAGSNGHATLGSSIDLDEPKAMLSAEAASNVASIDLVYSYSSTGSADKLFSPSHAKESGYNFAAGWASPNATKFYKVAGKTSTDFNAITTKEEIEALWVEATAVITSVDAAQGDVFIAKTNLNATVLMLIDTQTSGAAGSISLKIAK